MVRARPRPDRLGRAAEARCAAEAVGRIREALEPTTLGPRLDDDFRHLDEPRSLRDLADLAGHAGLSRLADACGREADALGQGGETIALNGLRGERTGG